MLKVNKQGVAITLNGSSSNDNLFKFATFLIIGAGCAALAMAFLSIEMAMGAMVLLVIASFVFNQLKQKSRQKKYISICSGTIEVQAGLIHYKPLGTKKQLVVLSDDRIKRGSTHLVVYSKDNHKKYHISGFEQAKEAEVMEHILTGQPLHKKNANIKMNTN